MNFNENISLQKYADSANQKFKESESRLSKIESNFQTRMNGKTTGGLVGSMLGTTCWLAAFGVSFWYLRGYIDRTLSLICLGIGIVLIISLFIDEIMSFSYYGKISSFKNNITQLKNRVSIGRNSIKSNQDAFMKSWTNGWNYPISVGSSIPEEATSIESIINGMESLKGGIINGLKNFLFFTFVIVITGVGSWALFGTADEIVSSIIGDPLDNETMKMLCFIGLLIVEVGEIILAKMLWSYTDCTVTNTTLWIVPLGPVLFLLLAVVVSLIVMLVILVASIVIAIGAICLICAVMFGITSGG